MGAGIEIPIHEAIIFDLSGSGAYGFLTQHPPGVFFIGQQSVERLPVPFRLAGKGKDEFCFQCRCDFSQAVAMEVTLENPVDDSGLISYRTANLFRMMVLVW